MTHNKTVELIPAIDLRNGKVVRLLQGDYQRQTTYFVDPVDTAKSFQDAGCWGRVHWSFETLLGGLVDLAVVPSDQAAAASNCTASATLRRPS